MPTLREYQSEDFHAVIESHRVHQSVIGRAATGTGKAVLLAALAKHYGVTGRVMVLVDVKKLVEQLAETIEWFTGVAPGIEMADARAFNSDGFHGSDRVVVSTVQTQYSGDEGRERFRQFDPKDFSALLLDECELFLAPTARAVVDYYMSGNPALRVFGTTATPMRTDGVTMGELFKHVAFDRDILWGINNGWLVPARQAFVKVSVDFSSLSVRKGEDGEADYSDEEIASRISDEATLVELAKGIIAVCGDRKTIVVCPNVSSAKAVAHYLEAERIGCARFVYGEMSDEDKRDTMAAHKAGEYQFLTSVMMLTKGYDDWTIQAVVNCRKTKSKRLYQQILGRGTRPQKGILETVPDPAGRRAAIADSAKPDMLMVNMVGVSDDVRDVTLVDILGNVDDAAVAERAKEIVAEEGVDTAEAVGMAAEEVAEERERAAQQAEVAQAKLDEEDALRSIRTRLNLTQTKADIQVDYEDDLRVGGGGAADQAAKEGIPDKQLNILRKAKVPEKDVARMNADQVKALSREVVRRWKLGLCSYRQAQCLQRAGFGRDELRDMSYEAASEAMDRVKANGWRRPAEVVA